jgi:NADH dehydrogenase
MTFNQKIACVFGGTGFIGRQVVRELAKAGYAVKVATRVPERAYELKTAGGVGQIVPVACDYNDDQSIAKAVAGCQAVVNCVGILFEKGRSSKFKKIHSELPARIAAACKSAGAQRLVHISALGADIATSRYAKSKREGEQGVLAKFPSATILRPSVVFGPGDEFFNMFGQLAIFLPALPLVGGGKTKFQPVYVGDVADAVIRSLTISAEAANSPLGKIYELGGPEVITLKEVYERTFAQVGRTPCLISLPWGVAKIQGVVMSMLPRPLMTADQVESLKTDNVLSGNQPTLADLGINETAIGTILPSYLSCYRPGGRFGDKKRA